MQSLILLSALSILVMNPENKKFDADKYITYLLEKEAQAEYKLEELLKADAEECDN